MTSRFSKRNPPKNLNLAFLEDPLLAQMSAASPLTPPAEETLFQPLDASLKLPDTPIADQFTDDYIECVTMEPEVDVQSAHLVTHAKVYAIAEKYVPPSVICRPCLSSPVLWLVSFCNAIATLCCVASRCVAYHGGKSPTPREVRHRHDQSANPEPCSHPSPRHTLAHGLLLVALPNHLFKHLDPIELCI